MNEKLKQLASLCRFMKAELTKRGIASEKLEGSDVTFEQVCDYLDAQISEASSQVSDVSEKERETNETIAMLKKINEQPPSGYQTQELPGEMSENLKTLMEASGVL